MRNSVISFDICTFQRLTWIKISNWLALGNENITELLLKNGARDKNYALTEAASYGNNNYDGEITQNLYSFVNLFELMQVTKRSLKNYFKMEPMWTLQATTVNELFTEQLVIHLNSNCLLI